LRFEQRILSPIHQPTITKSKRDAPRMKRAFTLIELLVVIAIIAILAAILFPVFAQAKLAAKQAADVSGIRQLGTSTTLYLADFDDTYMPLYYTDINQVSIPSNFGLWRWPWLLLPYAKSFDIFFSPADPEGQRFGSSPRNSSWGYLFGLSPSWGYNQRFYSPQDSASGLFAPINASAEIAPASSLVFASSYWATSPTSPKTGYYRLYPPIEWAGAPPVTGLSYGHVWPRFRGTHASVYFGDGHAKVLHINQVRKETLWRGGE
jgi:prepilin-type N-terminal cleavage/methylation domain-containing protein